MDRLQKEAEEMRHIDKADEELEESKAKPEIIVNTKNYDAQFIEKNKDIPEYFVVLPQYKTFFIPGSDKHRGNKTGYQIEDDNLAPSRDYYIPIGYIPKYKYSKEQEDQPLQELEKTSGKIYNIKKRF